MPSSRLRPGQTGAVLVHTPSILTPCSTACSIACWMHVQCMLEACPTRLSSGQSGRFFRLCAPKAASEMCFVAPTQSNSMATSSACPRPVAGGG
jgi:hypothetical protein